MLENLHKTSLSSPWGDCIENRTLNQHLGENLQYEEAGCIDDCIDDQVDDHCGCTDRLEKVFFKSRHR